ncbi:MAG TPA: class I tRNA ligase family protein, partial [Pyrinomonadaceae bacterium]
PAAASDEDKFAVREALESLVLMLTPFAPHTAEELYSVLVGNESGIVGNDARFPDHSAALAAEDEIEIAVQVNGKLRGRVFASPEVSNEELETLAFADEKVREHTDGKDVVKVVVVPKRLVNIVVRS